jgi:hypothetical protein
MNTRFKMSFGNHQPTQSINISQFQSSNHSLNTSSKQFNYSMISRVYKAKAGCSACGKKVM